MDHRCGCLFVFMFLICSLQPHWGTRPQWALSQKERFLFHLSKFYNKQTNKKKGENSLKRKNTFSSLILSHSEWLSLNTIKQHASGLQMADRIFFRLSENSSSWSIWMRRFQHQRPKKIGLFDGRVLLLKCLYFIFSSIKEAQFIKIWTLLGNCPLHIKFSIPYIFFV